MEREKKGTVFDALRQRGVSVRRMNYFLAGITLLITLLLLLATYRAGVSYRELRENTETYINWQQNAYELQIASDFLSEQVRCFAETGERQYLEAYFQEANVNRRRERALALAEGYMGDTDAFSALVAAMEESDGLMEREFYSMRLMVEAMGYPLMDFPEDIRNVELRHEHLSLTAEAQKDVARNMVFNQEYRDCKTEITANMGVCLAGLAQEVRGRQVETTLRLEGMLVQQRTLIIILIIAAVITVLISRLLVINPLLHAEGYIRSEQPIPEKGSLEFRFLARTYNTMFEAGREKKEQLAYEASHDKLTGVYNRSGYDFLLKEADLASSALLIVDVDKFKGINDTFGHDIGDRVLIKVADNLRSSFRSQDRICRIGGDEFVVIMIQAQSAAREMVEGKLRHINELLLSPEDTEGVPPVSLSCGGAFGWEGADRESLFRRADEALYEVKRSGGCGCRVREGSAETV